MTQSCQECMYYNAVSNTCQFPLPTWVMRELHDPLHGGGKLAAAMRPTDGHDCPAFKRKEPT